MKKTYTGSCHCGAVRFEADIDLAAGTSRCNCSFCSKSRNWNARIRPEDFRLLSGDAVLGNYQFGTLQAHHRFCTKCGIRSFGQGDVPEMGGQYVSVQLGCLDDAPAAELLSGPIQFCDGRDDNWWNVPAETRHL